jgi:prepilin-type N-terminal cleavage/methylation domain-containing protein
LPFPCGFTLVEIQVAVLLLGVGVAAILGTAALDIRMVGRGRQTTRAVLAAVARLEALRARAAAPGHCGGLSGGSDSLFDGSIVQWTLPNSGTARLVTVAVSYQVAGAPRVDSLTTLLGCP